MILHFTIASFLSIAALAEAQEQTSSQATTKWPVGAWVGLAIGITVLCALVAIVIARVDYYCCFSRPESPGLSYDNEWQPPYSHPSPTFVHGLVVPSHGSSASSEDPPGYLGAGYRPSYSGGGYRGRDPQPRRGLNYDYYHPPPGLEDRSSEVASPKRAHAKVGNSIEFARYT
ncbi:hypothetical protein OE88DRAFT_1809551 [Heliocybe sulcata]|uniref:Uncharacterized protein n=1 Tax=Heliocybe sulcata TaxID=5364 RepID=A0A5C3MWI3_9AGAM|nr:hypothetical protein OE88DRAFT_1809551 [Heliocybe sulcata]